ncbi:MAG: hypothetical protein MUC86_06625 [Burkholderiaceae bacterium]|jgi:hypothetical protein|nr:hypothetical protein [Burkholderiaceae bacterium]
MKRAALSLALILALSLTAGHVAAQAAGSAAPKTYALVSAVGDQVNYVQQRMQTGTSFEGFRRTRVLVNDKSVDAAVLRGMDSVLARREPQSQRVFLRLSPGKLDGVPDTEREKVALEKLTAELQKLPQRAQWDRIFVITPHYRMGERRGLASKLHGMGVYVQGLESNLTSGALEGVQGTTTGAVVNVEGDQDTRLPDGSRGFSSRRYVALYSYTQMWVLDAKTLKVIANEPWLFDEKIFDPLSESIDVAKQLSPDELAARFESFAERAAGRALAQTVPMVEAGEPRIVDTPAPRR